MPMGELGELVLWVPAILVALTVHEFAHALTAYLLGDDTPVRHGRLTLNPLVHIDWLGLLLLVVAHFGWAKPVPVTPARMERVGARAAMTLVAGAGPASNVLLAVLGLLALQAMSPQLAGAGWQGAAGFLQALVRINVLLAAFNLVPLPPLDGSKLVVALLPGLTGPAVARLEPYGTLVLVLLIATGAMRWVLYPFLAAVSGLVSLAIL